MKKRFTEEQIIKILEESKAGITVAEIAASIALPSQPIIAGRQNTEL
jgi:hypothetical protein